MTYFKKSWWLLFPNGLRPAACPVGAKEERSAFFWNAFGARCKASLRTFSLKNLYHGHLDMSCNDDLAMVKNQTFSKTAMQGIQQAKQIALFHVLDLTSQTNQLISTVPIYLLSSLDLLVLNRYCPPWCKLKTEIKLLKRLSNHWFLFWVWRFLP